MWGASGWSVTCVTQYLRWQGMENGVDAASADFPECRLILVQALKVQGPSNLAF